MSYTRGTSTEPRYVELEQVNANAKPLRVDRSGQTWWIGRAPIKEHPLAEYAEGEVCRNCASRELEIVAGQESVHPYSGDEYFDLELYCKACKHFTQVSYSEND